MSVFTWEKNMDTDYQESSIDRVVYTQKGQKYLDSFGAPIAGVRMDVSRAYASVPGLLQQVIDNNDQAAWNQIIQKIDYIFENLDHSLAGLDRETGFASKVKAEMASGKKLLIKPNIIGPMVIDPKTHGEGAGAPICTEWPFISALMRWFHDKMDIDYSQMALGEASTSTFFMASLISKFMGKSITTEAVIEGRSDDFYGGWGFHFVRRYLSHHHPSSHDDDPLNGYEDSVAGRFLPPGRAGNRLMVYDLNKIEADPCRGRSVPVPEGANFQEITLHKVIIGGDPGDAVDRMDYPGCVLVNVPKLKIHAQDLLTNAIKNLGIGLYPTQCASSDGSGDTSWKYAYPSTSIPTYKGKLPHSPWITEIDAQTHLPVKDENGEYIVKKTAGMSGTQSDVIRAVQDQGVYMMHIVDAIDIINISHNPDGKAVRVPEGFVWSSLDCVALDLFCARYCFKTVPMVEAMKLKSENGWPTEFVHHVPVAKIDGKNIVTETGMDSPLFRYHLYRYAEARGVGQQRYHVVGWDALMKTPLVSFEGHLGRIENGAFVELMTRTMYYNPTTILHDLQKTILSYADAHDRLTGSSLLQEFMNGFDENHDGVIDYDEKGRKGVDTAQFVILAHAMQLMISEGHRNFEGSFVESRYYIKNSDKQWNSHGHDFTKESLMVFKAAAAFEMSQFESVHDDHFIPGMVWGKGMWPGWQMVTHSLINTLIFGAQSSDGITLESMYGLAFQYADKILNAGGYTNNPNSFPVSAQSAIARYLKAVSEGERFVDFEFYVPMGYGSLNGLRIPNITETEDPAKIFTVRFNNGSEVW
jgi:hypothetical protein